MSLTPTNPPDPAHGPNIAPFLLAGIGCLIFVALTFSIVSNIQQQQEAPPSKPAARTSSAPLPSPAAVPETPPWELTDVNWEYRHGMLGIKGVFVNHTDTTFRAVVLTYPIYDKSGALIANAVDSMERIRPGERWKFWAMTNAKDIHHFGEATVEISR